MRFSCVQGKRGQEHGGSVGLFAVGEKAALARGAGTDEVILYTEQDFETEVKRLTNGAGLQVIYETSSHREWSVWRYLPVRSARADSTSRASASARGRSAAAVGRSAGAHRTTPTRSPRCIGPSSWRSTGSIPPQCTASAIPKS